MKIAIVTGSSGLIGSEAVTFLSGKDFKVVGIDNDMRKYFFGKDASTVWNQKRLKETVKGFVHKNTDVRDQKKLERIFKEYGSDIKLIVHAAAQPSHDWAAKEPFTDFTVNANGTLNLLEMTRRYSSKAVFAFMSTNKVYGDSPNSLPVKELGSRYELPESHAFFGGIDETMTVDRSTHSLFGASKLAADICVQEYGRYFGMKTAAFRGGCLTGPNHSGAKLHGFLSYLMKCCVTGEEYTIFGYNGKQVRDNIHSHDLISALYHFYQDPKEGEVYNIGGGRENSCSVLEAIKLCEDISGKKMKYSISEQARRGDHIWYISSLKKFSSQYPAWKQEYGLRKTMEEIFQEIRSRNKGK